jgi:hypothetical protein
VGYIEDIQAMDLSDDVKQSLIDAHNAEVNPLRESNQSLQARERRERVNGEVEQLKSLGFEEAPGLLAYVRRVFLSADAEEPGAVLLSDNEMGLSGEVSTGATTREEVSVAGALRKFIELMPKTGDGQLAVKLSDQVDGASGDHGRPDKGGDLDVEEREAQVKARAARLSGRTIDRETVRGKRYRTASITGGGE